MKYKRWLHLLSISRGTVSYRNTGVTDRRGYYGMSRWCVVVSRDTGQYLPKDIDLSLFMVAKFLDGIEKLELIDGESYV